MRCSSGSAIRGSALGRPKVSTPTATEGPASLAPAVPAGLAQNDAVADMHRHAPLQIRQSEVSLSIAAIGRAENRKQRLILVDRQQLAIAKRPALGREVERENPDFANIGGAHKIL